MQNLLYDLRYGIRQLRKTPGMALLAILTLALGVGANTAIFTVIDNVLLRPLPYAHSDRLVFIGPGGDKPSFGSTSWLNFADIRTQSQLLEGAVGYAEDVSVLEARDSSISVVAPRVTTNLFSMLGQRPMLGRTFTDVEGQAGGPPVVMLSEGLWRDTFHCRPEHCGPGCEAGRKAYDGGGRDAGVVQLSRKHGCRPEEGCVAADSTHAGDVEGSRLPLLQRRRDRAAGRDRGADAAGAERHQRATFPTSTTIRRSRFVWIPIRRC